MSLFSKYRIVRANERVVEYVDGAFTRVLGPGARVPHDLRPLIALGAKELREFRRR